MAFSKLTFSFLVQHFEGYDAEGFSMWLCDYKYNDENTINYVVMNKVSAWPSPAPCLTFTDTLHTQGPLSWYPVCEKTAS